MPNANDVLMAGGLPSVKFPSIGATAKGKVVRFESTQQTDPKTRRPLYYDDNRPKMQVIVTLATDERDPELPHDNGERVLYVKGQMMAAVRDAIRVAGADGLEVGGTLAVQYTADKPSETPGFSPSKVYVAQYVRPVAAVTTTPDMGAAVTDLI